MNIVPVEIPLGIILEKTKFNISKIIIHNDSSKAQKNCWLKFLAFWNICNPKTQLIKIHYSLDFQTTWKTVRKLKNMWFLRIIFAWKFFQNMLRSKFQKTTGKRNFMVLRLYFIWSTFPTKMIYYRRKLLLECY